MNRTEIEQKLWADQYHYGMALSEDKPIACEFADAAVERFRQRYPVEPAAPEAVWYDEPPFPKDGKSYACWVDGDAVHGDVHWSNAYNEWRVWIVGSSLQQPLAGRPVCPIVKPQEPPQ